MQDRRAFQTSQDNPLQLNSMPSFTEPISLKALKVPHYFMSFPGCTGAKPLPYAGHDLDDHPITRSMDQVETFVVSAKLGYRKKCSSFRKRLAERSFQKRHLAGFRVACFWHASKACYNN